MRKQFSRTFRLFNRLFPGANTGIPSAFHDELLLTAEAMRPSFIHDARLRTSFVSNVGAGADMTLTHPAPSQGYVALPVNLAVLYDQAANIEVRVNLEDTPGVTPDPWGRWNEGSTRVIGTVRSGASQWIGAPIFPYPFGNQVSVTFETAAVGSIGQSVLHWIEVPGELCSLELWLQKTTNFVNTRALA